MSDDSAKAEEERIQRAMNRKTRASMVVKPTHSNEPSAPPPSFQKPFAAKPVTEKPKPVPAIISPTTNQSIASRSGEIEALQLKKRTILGTIGTTRRDLEEVRAEIAKLKSKEAELVSLLEKRDLAVQQLNQDIEDLEKKDHTEELRRQEDAKARRVATEIDRRRQEEVEEERKKLDEQEGKSFNPQPIYSPRGGEEDARDLDGLTAEEQRIMRAMSRPGKGGTAGSGATIGGGRVSSVKSSSAVSKPVNEAERQRIAEENRRKEEEQRAHQERDLQQRIAHLQAPGGVRKTFVSSQCYDFDAEVKFVADFTNFEEIPITTPIDNNFTYSVTWSVKPGPHFYMFKINGKTEINKNLATGLAPNGSLMNKVDC